MKLRSSFRGSVNSWARGAQVVIASLRAQISNLSRNYSLLWTRRKKILYPANFQILFTHLQNFFTFPVKYSDDLFIIYT